MTMWIYLNDAHLSIVAHREDEEKLLVRARLQGDIERTFPRAQVTETTEADYRFRAVLPREWVADTIARLVEGIGYPNFKGSVRDADRHEFYLQVWSVGRRAQLAYQASRLPEFQQSMDF